MLTMTAESKAAVLTMTIDEKACRGCELCLDICPIEVIVFDQAQRKAKVQTAENCIACLSCAYICPSGAIEHNNYHIVQNFYRNLDFVEKTSRFI